MMSFLILQEPEREQLRRDHRVDGNAADASASKGKLCRGLPIRGLCSFCHGCCGFLEAGLDLRSSGHRASARLEVSWVRELELGCAGWASSRGFTSGAGARRGASSVAWSLASSRTCSAAVVSGPLHLLDPLSRARAAAAICSVSASTSPSPSKRHKSSQIVTTAFPQPPVRTPAHVCKLTVHREATLIAKISSKPNTICVSSKFKIQILLRNSNLNSAQKFKFKFCSEIQISTHIYLSIYPSIYWFSR